MLAIISCKNAEYQGFLRSIKYNNCQDFYTFDSISELEQDLENLGLEYATNKYIKSIAKEMFKEAKEI